MGFRYLTFNNISDLEIYQVPFKYLPIPEKYRVSEFRSPKPRDIIFSVISWAPVKATAVFPPDSPRYILEKIEPCEICGRLEPVILTEIKKSIRATKYSLKLLCEDCIQKNKELIK